MRKLKYTENYLKATWFSFEKTFLSINDTSKVDYAFSWDSLGCLGKKFERAYYERKQFKDYNLHLLGTLTNVEHERRDELDDEED